MKKELIILTKANGNGKFTIANASLEVYKINFGVVDKNIFHNILSFIVQTSELIIKKFYRNIKFAIKEMVDFWKLYYNNTSRIKNKIVAEK